MCFLVNFIIVCIINVINGKIFFQVQEFGVTETRDLIPNGRTILVTEESKMEYIRRVCIMKMTGAIRKQ